MTANEKMVLIHALRKRAEEEMKEFKDYLCTKSAEEILINSFRYSVYQDIFLYIMACDFTEKELEKLASFKKPISFIFHEFLNRDSGNWESYHEILTREMERR